MSELAVVGDYDRLHVFDPSTGAARTVHCDEPGAPFRSLLDAQGSVAALRASTSPLRLVLCDVTRGDVVARVWEGHEGALSTEGDPAALAALPAAVGSWEGDCPQLLEIDLVAGVRTHELPWLAGTERGFTVHSRPGSRRALVLDGEGPAVLYDLDRRTVLEQLPVHVPTTARVQQLADGTCWLVDVPTNGHVVHVDAEGQLLRRWPVRAPLALSVEPAGRYGAVTLRDRVDVLDLSTGRTMRSTVPYQRPGSNQGPLLLPDGRLVFWSRQAGFEVLAP